jgi:hypothetical protein
MARLQAAQDRVDGERARLVEQQHQLAVEQQAMAAFRWGRGLRGGL